MGRNKNKREGEISYCKDGSKMQIIKYINSLKVIVMFDDVEKNTKTVIYDCFLNGHVKNIYKKSVYGVGFIGYGEFKSKINNKNSKIYSTWSKMLERCYTDRKRSYKNVFVCEEWHNFQNFAKWYVENYYELKDEIIEIDKDILIKNNKIYSPQTCIFVPKKINDLIVNHKQNRSSVCLGVTQNTSNYSAVCNIMYNGKKIRYIGTYKTKEEAFNEYKKIKESHIKNVAEIYKNKIPLKLYKALYNYEVEIND